MKGKFLQHLVNMNIVSSYYRFSRIPSFGIDGIRHFPSNVAEMRQNVAQHFEDMLQVGNVRILDATCLLHGKLTRH